MPSMSGSIQSSTIRSGSNRGDGGERLAAAGGLLDVVALVAERRRDRVDDRRLVVDDEDPLRGSGPFDIIDLIMARRFCGPAERTCVSAVSRRAPGRASRRGRERAVDSPGARTCSITMIGAPMTPARSPSRLAEIAGRGSPAAASG